MKLFTKFKKMFSSDIEPEPNKLVGIVCPYALKGGAVKVDSNVTVPSGYSFVLGYKGKALDCFNEGKFPLSPGTLPDCCYKLKIHKQNKKGQFKKSFKVNAYFVNLKEFEFFIETYDKAELGNRASGIFSVGLSCNMKIKVVDAKKFMENLLNEYDYIKNGEAEKLFKIWCSELIQKILYRYNFALSEFISNNSIIKDNLVIELGKKFNKLGLMLLEINNIIYNLPKKYQKEYLKNVGKTVEEKNETIQETSQEEQKEENNSTEEEKILCEEAKEKQEEIVKEESYVPFGNMLFEEETDNEKVDNNVINQSENEEQIQEQEEKLQETEFVDLNLDNLYKTNESNSNLKCEYCGYVNEQGNLFCEVCGTKLKGDNNE